MSLPLALYGATGYTGVLITAFVVWLGSHGACPGVLSAAFPSMDTTPRLKRSCRINPSSSPRCTTWCTSCSRPSGSRRHSNLSNVVSDTARLLFGRSLEVAMKGLAVGLGQPGARYLGAAEVRWRVLGGGLYVLGTGGTLLFAEGDGALRPGAFASVGLGVDNAR